MKKCVCKGFRATSATGHEIREALCKECYKDWVKCYTTDVTHSWGGTIYRNWETKRIKELQIKQSINVWKK